MRTIIRWVDASFEALQAFKAGITLGRRGGQREADGKAAWTKDEWRDALIDGGGKEHIFEHTSENSRPKKGDTISRTLTVDYVSVDDGVIYTQSRPKYPIPLSDVEPVLNQPGCWKIKK